MSARYRFDGQVAVITGAATGSAWRSRPGWRTRAPAWCSSTGRRRRCTRRPRSSAAWPVVADVSEESEVDGYVAAAVEAHGRIDLFFNNAGIEGRMAPMTELSVADFDRVWAVNARGVFMGLRAVLRVMKPQGSGAIVNTASMAAIKGAATFSPYIASKHAVLGLTKSAALEGAPYGIRVNCVAPGHIDTRMARDLTAQINPSDPEGVFAAVSRVGAAVRQAVRDRGRGRERGGVAAVVGVGVRVRRAAPDRRRAERRLGGLVEAARSGRLRHPLRLVSCGRRRRRSCGRPRRARFSGPRVAGAIRPAIPIRAEAAPSRRTRRGSRRPRASGRCRARRPAVSRPRWWWRAVPAGRARAAGSSRSRGSCPPAWRRGAGRRSGPGRRHPGRGADREQQQADRPVEVDQPRDAWGRPGWRGSRMSALMMSVSNGSLCSALRWV